MGSEEQSGPEDQLQSLGVSSGQRELRILARTLVATDRINGDNHIIALAAEIRHLDAALRDLLSADTRDTDEIPGFTDVADRLAVSIDRLCADRALSLSGIVVKAEVAMTFRAFEGERAGRVALSLASDIQVLGAVR